MKKSKTGLPFMAAYLITLLTVTACSPDEPTEETAPTAASKSNTATTPSPTPVKDFTETPEPTSFTNIPVPSATSTSIPEDRSVSYRSLYGNWTVYEIPRELTVQVVNDEGTIRWGIDWNSVEPIYGNDFNHIHFFEDAIYFGVGPVNYEIQILQREAPIYSLYRLDLVDGSISRILEPLYGDDGFAEYAYFQLSRDQEYVVYSRWYSNEIVIRDLSTQLDTAFPIPEGWLLAGLFGWSPDMQQIALTMWQDDYEVPTHFAVALLDIASRTITTIVEDDESDY
jgi:hypothetical protein